MNRLFIQSTLVLLMFLLSGIDKTNDINKVALLLKDKVNLLFSNIQYMKIDIPFNLYYLAIIIVIFLQICGSLTIIYSSITQKYKKESYYFILGLIVFTILATILFHMPPTGSNYHTFLNHLAVIGGLLLLADKFQKIY